MQSKLAAVVITLTAMLAGCGPGGLQPAGIESGVPDTIMGDPQRNAPTGIISTGGTMWSRQNGYLTTPYRR